MDRSLDRDDFDTQVHEALAHLYDLPFLQRSPLVEALGLRAPDGRGGSALHRHLLAAIEELKPPREVSPEAMAWKTYRSLVLRYVRSLNAGATASELGLSPRQAQRIHLAALEAIATVLWERRREAIPAASVSGEPAAPPALVDDEALDAELQAVLAGDHGEREPFPAIVHSALATVEPVLRQRGVSVDLTIDDALAPGIAPRDVVRQALVQLLLHALDQTAGGRLLVAARAAPPRGARLRIAPVDSSAASLADPTDLRLRVAERLVRAIGGTVTVADPPDRAVTAAVPLGRAPTVLAVEDNPQVVQLFRRYLHGSIYRLLHVPDPDVLVQRAGEEQPAVITLDVMMPRRDGWELLQALKVRPETRDIPVLVCSVLRDRELALALGAADFLPKPITQHTLLAALNRHALRPSEASA